jgi:hypothetical protein
MAMIKKIKADDDNPVPSVFKESEQSNKQEGEAEGSCCYHINRGDMIRVNDEIKEAMAKLAGQVIKDGTRKL